LDTAVLDFGGILFLGVEDAAREEGEEGRCGSGRLEKGQEREGCGGDEDKETKKEKKKRQWQEKSKDEPRQVQSWSWRGINVKEEEEKKFGRNEQSRKGIN